MYSGKWGQNLECPCQLCSPPYASAGRLMTHCLSCCYETFPSCLLSLHGDGMELLLIDAASISGCPRCVAGRIRTTRAIRICLRAVHRNVLSKSILTLTHQQRCKWVEFTKTEWSTDNLLSEYWQYQGATVQEENELKEKEGERV